MYKRADERLGDSPFLRFNYEPLFWSKIKDPKEDLLVASCCICGGGALLGDQPGVGFFSACFFAVLLLYVIRDILIMFITFSFLCSMS